MMISVDWGFILAILLFASGFVLVGIEMITPGLHAPGIIGTGCLFAAILIVSDSFVEGALITLAVFGVLAIMLGIILALLSSGKLKSPIILQEEQRKDTGYLSSSNLSHMLGKQGIALTDLRPSGTGSFDKVHYDVITEGGYITKNTAIVVYKVEGSKLIIKAKEE